MGAMDPEPVDDEPDVADEADLDLDPREAARVRRRDHDAGAQERDLMRPGMGKVFKQIDDAIVRRAKPSPRHGRHSGGHAS